jgi:hypothetical protein
MDEKTLIMMDTGFHLKRTLKIKRIPDNKRAMTGMSSKMNKLIQTNPAEVLPPKNAVPN